MKLVAARKRISGSKSLRWSRLLALSNLVGKNRDSTPNAMQLSGRHSIGMALEPDFAYLKNACPAVRSENQAEQLRYEIVEFLAVAGVGHDAAVGARGIAVFLAAGSHLAPRRLLVLVAAGATFAAVRSTCSAIQAAIGGQIHVGNNWFHINTLNNPTKPSPIGPAETPSTWESRSAGRHALRTRNCNSPGIRYT
jgi:hypothetical protein